MSTRGPLRDRLDRFLMESRATVEGLDESELAVFVDFLRSAPRRVVFGLGRSGDMLRAFADGLVTSSHETRVLFTPGVGRIRETDILLLASATASSSTLGALAEEGRGRGGRVALITANALSPLARSAAARLTLPPLLSQTAEPGGEGAALASMQLRFDHALLFVLDAIAHEMGARYDDHG
ncbi:MAG: hypothetical protein KDB53_08660 [Planctomycetes bacterium]|nr:hypothetical protein [Planctomycetota bacterium]